MFCIFFLLIFFQQLSANQQDSVQDYTAPFLGVENCGASRSGAIFLLESSEKVQKTKRIFEAFESLSDLVRMTGSHKACRRLYSAFEMLQYIDQLQSGLYLQSDWDGGCQSVEESNTWLTYVCRSIQELEGVPYLDDKSKQYLIDPLQEMLSIFHYKINEELKYRKKKSTPLPELDHCVLSVVQKHHPSLYETLSKQIVVCTENSESIRFNVDSDFSQTQQKRQDLLQLSEYFLTAAYSLVANVFASNYESAFFRTSDIALPVCLEQPSKRVAHYICAFAKSMAYIARMLKKIDPLLGEEKSIFHIYISRTLDQIYEDSPLDVKNCARGSVILEPTLANWCLHILHDCCTRNVPCLMAIDISTMIHYLYPFAPHLTRIIGYMHNEFKPQAPLYLRQAPLLEPLNKCILLSESDIVLAYLSSNAPLIAQICAAIHHHTPPYTENCEIMKQVLQNSNFALQKMLKEKRSLPYERSTLKAVYKRTIMDQDLKIKWKMCKKAFFKASPEFREMLHNIPRGKKRPDLFAFVDCEFLSTLAILNKYMQSPDVYQELQNILKDTQKAFLTLDHYSLDFPTPGKPLEIMEVSFMSELDNFAYTLASQRVYLSCLCECIKLFESKLDFEHLKALHNLMLAKVKNLVTPPESIVLSELNCEDIPSLSTISGALWESNQSDISLDKQYTICIDTVRSTIQHYCPQAYKQHCHLMSQYHVLLAKYKLIQPSSYDMNVMPAAISQIPGCIQERSRLCLKTIFYKIPPTQNPTKALKKIMSRKRTLNTKGAITPTPLEIMFTFFEHIWGANKGYTFADLKSIISVCLQTTESQLPLEFELHSGKPSHHEDDLYIIKSTEYLTYIAQAKVFYAWYLQAKLWVDACVYITRAPLAVKKALEELFLEEPINSSIGHFFLEYRI